MSAGTNQCTEAFFHNRTPPGTGVCKQCEDVLCARCGYRQRLHFRPQDIKHAQKSVPQKIWCQACREQGFSGGGGEYTCSYCTHTYGQGNFSTSQIKNRQQNQRIMCVPCEERVAALQKKVSACTRKLACRCGKFIHQEKCPLHQWRSRQVWPGKAKGVTIEDVDFLNRLPQKSHKWWFSYKLVQPAP